MTTHRVTFDLKVEGGRTEATELELIAEFGTRRQDGSPGDAVARLRG